MRKNVMVTGADRGLGFALCEEFLKTSGRQTGAESGTTFQVIAGRYMEEWKELDALKQTYPDRLICVPLDVGDDNSVKTAVQKVMERVETVDMLIHCAGINGTIRDIRDGYDYPGMLRTLNVNALGAIRVTEAFLPLMDRGTDKKICCISSEAGSIGTCWREDETEYCMSKAALNAGMAVLSNRLKKDGYEIRLYHPGWMNTYMMGTKEEHADLNPEEAARLALQSFFKIREQEKLVLDSYDGSIIPW